MLVNCLSLLEIYTNMPSPRTYCGGIAETNGYAFEAPDGWVAVDAPEGMRDWLSSNQLKPEALLLTHMHFDHVMDAAVISAEFGCPVYAHSPLTPELHLGILFSQFTGVALDIPEFELAKPLEGEDSISIAGAEFVLLHVPGHSPDSVCFSLPGDDACVFAGDTLFQSGIGRTDFPGGDEALLLSGIREKLLTLPESTRVYPGHGDPTTIQAEKIGNPYVRLAEL
jgi:hydroxyacylglutathione hydrolase